MQWTNVPAFTEGAPTGTVTFQVILFDDGTLDIYYDDVSSAIFLENATIGIENADGSDGAQVAFNTAYVRDGLALRFIAPEIPLTPFISDVSPLSGVVPAGGETTIDVSLDASNLLAGVFFDELRLSSNSPDITRSTTLFELNVLEGPRVTGFTLVDAKTNDPIGPLVEGDVIDLADFLLDAKFSIIANIGEVPIGSVVFDFNGENGFQTENFAPYALDGDRNGDFIPVNIPLGLNTITATPFTETKGNGDSGLSSTVNFEVIRTLQPITFALIDADTNTILSVIDDGTSIDLGTFNTTDFSIEAFVDGTSVGSIVFNFNGQDAFQTENFEPYSLSGDRNGDFRPLDIPLGTNELTANGFSKKGGQGDLIATGTISFEVTRSLNAISFNLINADTNATITIIEDGDSIDLGQFETSNFTIEATPEGIDVGSIVFDFNGQNGVRTENFVPYSLSGDRRGDFRPFDIPLGTNNLIANGFSGRDGQGDLLATGTIAFDIQNTLSSEIKVFPNASSDIVNVGYKSSSSRKLTGAVFNMFGQLVRSNLVFDFESSSTQSFSIANLTQGIYILELRDERDNVVSQKKVVRR